MKRYDRLIFVSSSDTSVGPMAEAILQSKYLLEELEITSKGVVVLFPEPINPKEEIQIVLKRYLEHIVLFFYERDLARGRITKKNS